MTGRTLNFAVAAMIAMGAASMASAQHIDVEFDQGADFSIFKTFAIRDGQIHSRSPVLNSDLVKKHIEDEITARLTAKGLTRVTSGQADLNVRYSLGSAPHPEIETYPAGWRGLGTRVVRVPRTEGTLVINLRDAAFKTLVWRTVATADADNPSKIHDKLDDMVRKSMDKYPPKK